MQKEKALQLKEMEFAHTYQQNQKKSEILELEKFEVEKE